MKNFIMEVNYLEKATIPIIKATCNAELDFKSIDISYQDEQHNGLKSVELIKNYLQVYPEAENLVLVLKKFIYESKLFAPYHGGLSSYALFLMIIAFIQN
jgi:DNA polymerase sigma